MSQYLHLSEPAEEWLEYTKNGIPPPLNGPLESIRTMLATIKSITNQKTDMPFDSLEIGEIEIPSRTDSSIHARWYRPKDGIHLPVVVIFHGGGFALGNLDNEEGAFIADRCSALVLNVDYRLAPEHPFPCGLEDCYDSIKWAATKSQSLGCQPERGFIVGGISAGATLSAVCSQLARDESLQPPLSGQFLSLPSTIHHSVYPEKWKDELLSYDQNADAPIVNKESAETFEEYYQVSDWGDPRVSPALHPNLTNLPPAYFQIAGLDLLRDEGFLYNRLLQDSGVDTRVDVYPGLPHAFWNFPSLPSSKKWIEDTVKGVEWLLQHVAVTSSRTETN